MERGGGGGGYRGRGRGRHGGGGGREGGPPRGDWSGGGGRGRGGGSPGGDRRGGGGGSRGFHPSPGFDSGYGGRGGGGGRGFQPSSGLDSGYGGRGGVRGFQPSSGFDSGYGGRGGGGGRGFQPSSSSGGRGIYYQPKTDRSGAVSEQWSGAGGETRIEGYGRGGGRDGAGPSHSPAPVPDPVPELGKLQITEQRGATSLSAAERKDKIEPIRRPDKGGTLAVGTSKLQVNHFLVKFNPESRIMHYDVVVRPKSPVRGRPPKLTKSDLREILFSADPLRLALVKTAYDGEKNIFSAVPLPEGTFTVEISNEEDERSTSYEVTLALVNVLEFRKLREYLSRNVFAIPRDVLQGMDLVMKENPARRTLSLGRNFYSRNPSLHRDLYSGIIAIGGFQHSLKPSSQGLSLCLDYSVLSFRKPIPVLDFLHEHIPNFRLGEFHKFKSKVMEALIKLKVNVTHRRCKQKFTIERLTDRITRDLTFPFVDSEGRKEEVRLVNYFRDRYNTEIVHQDIPSLDVGKGRLVPMEFCVLVEGQRYPKEHLDDKAAATLRDMSIASPDVRAREILNMVKSSDGPCGGGIIQSFEMDVNTSMTEVMGRIIGPPELKLGDPRGRVNTIKLDPQKCQWNIVGKSMVEAMPLQRWGIIDFTSREQYRFRFRVDEFVDNLKIKYDKLGICMEYPACYEASSMDQLGSYDSLFKLLKKVDDMVSESCGGRPQFILCVMTGKDARYRNLKWVSETQLGLVTQCCLSSNVNKGKDSYLSNLAIKINAKLGGSNVELNRGLPHFGGEGHVMFIGADVNHPAARDTENPSIAAVVATVNWSAANRYAARVSPQRHRCEKILNFGGACLELLRCYERLNQVKPQKIVIFRDGVSEGQFDMVLNEELQDLKTEFECLNYFPSITLIVAQKRHQTRFFRDRVHNMLPGTVVDTKVVHPFEFDFYLCSHRGLLGTSKATHYHVLWDENRFTSDNLQKLIYEMCFTFARCTQPVSLVPPVYYADLAAYRGRLYHEARTIGFRYPPSSAPSMEQGFYRLPGDLQNMMFFV